MWSKKGRRRQYHRTDQVSIWESTLKKEKQCPLRKYMPSAMTNWRSSIDTSNRTKAEDELEESSQEEHRRSYSSRKKTAKSDYAPIIERSTNSPRRIDTRSHSLVKHWIDGEEPSTSPSWTSRTPITTFESEKETNGRQPFQQNWELTNT